MDFSNHDDEDWGDDSPVKIPKKYDDDDIQDLHESGFGRHDSKTKLTGISLVKKKTIASKL